MKLQSGDGYIAFSDDAGKLHFVYFSPIAQYGKKTITLPIEWDGASNSVVATIPDTVSYPVLIAFGVSPQILSGREKWSVVFPSLRRRLSPSGNVDDRSSSESDSSDSSADEKGEGKEKKRGTKVVQFNVFFSVAKVILYFRSSLSLRFSISSKHGLHPCMAKMEKDLSTKLQLANLLSTNTPRSACLFLSMKMVKLSSQTPLGRYTINLCF